MDLLRSIFKGDKVIWIIFLFLCLISIVEVFSAASTLTYKSGDHWGPITQHSIILMVGAVVVVFMHNIPYKWFQVFPVFLLPLSVYVVETDRKRGSVYSFLKDSKGRTWIGPGWGLYVSQPKERKFHRVEEVGYNWVFNIMQSTLMKQDGIEEGPTLLLQCEEGEEEYSEKYLDENGLFLFNIEEREKLNKTFFENCEKIYHPVQVIIEYNGTWDLQEILDEDFPRNWEIQGVYSTVSGETLDMYLKNMRNMLMNALRSVFSPQRLMMINSDSVSWFISIFRIFFRYMSSVSPLTVEYTP